MSFNLRWKKPPPDMGPVRLPQEFWDDVAILTAGSILENILTQKKADGGRLKINSPRTREAKRAKGRPLLSLVDAEHRFVKDGGASWAKLRYTANGQGVVVGPSNQELKDLVIFTGQKGYGGYLGVSAKLARALGQLLRKELEKYVRRKNRG